MQKQNKPARIAIIAAVFHQPLADHMIEAAQQELKAHKARLLNVITVPGSYEIPLIADMYLRRKDIDALIVLGCIEKGETLHGEVMGHVVHDTLLQLQVRYRKPIGLGIIGPGATADQAEVRKEKAAQGAVRAALASLKILRK